MKYIIEEETFEGFDWHDARTVYEQLSYEGSKFVPKERINWVIAERIHSTIVSYQESDGSETFMFTVVPSTEEILDVITRKDKIEYIDEDEYHQCIIDASKSEEGSIATLDLSTQYEWVESYYVTEIPDEQIGYLPVEEFYAPWKGAFTVTRTYSDKVFDNYEDAKTFIDNIPEHTDFRDRKYKINIVNKSLFEGEAASNEWYEREKEVIKVALEKGISVCDKAYFSISPDRHLKNLKGEIIE